MVASYKKLLKTSANFTKFFSGTYERLLLLHDHFLCLDKQYAADDIVAGTRKFKIHGSEFKFFVSIT